MSYWQEIVGDTFNWRALYLSSWRSKTLTYTGLHVIRIFVVCRTQRPP